MENTCPYIRHSAGELKDLTALTAASDLERRGSSSLEGTSQAGRAEWVTRGRLVLSTTIWHHAAAGEFRQLMNEYFL